MYMIDAYSTSEVVTLKDILGVVTGILEPPSPETSFPESSEDGAQEPKPRPRWVVLVGHDIEQDIEHLKKIGYDVYGNQQLLDVVDSMHMHQHMRQSVNPSSLGNVLGHFGILSRHLHNGGNDAVYTLQVMLALAIKNRQVSLATRRHEEKNRSVERHTHLAHRCLPRWTCSFSAPSLPVEDEGWRTGGEDSDGGNPVRPVDPNAFVSTWLEGDDAEIGESVATSYW